MEDLCKRCGICCRYIPVNTDNNTLLRDSIQPLSKEFEEMLIPLEDSKLQHLNILNTNFSFNCNIKLFRCKYLINENICSNPHKPQECKDFPSKPFAFIPDDCGYYGAQFLKNEELKQKIRKIKEEILHYETLTITDPKEKHAYQRIIEKLKKIIQKHAIYGSEDW